MTRLIVLLWLLWLPVQAFANVQTLVIDQDTDDALALTPWVSQLQTDTEISLGELPQAQDPRWQPQQFSAAQLGGARNLWLKLDIRVHANAGTRILRIDNPLLDSLQLFHMLDGTLLGQQHLGDNLPFLQRPLSSSHLLYPLQLSPGLHTLLIRVDTLGNAQVPLSLLTPLGLSELSERHSLGDGLLLGMLVAIGLFSLFVALTTQSFSYRYHAGYAFTVALLVAAGQGVAFRYLWPQWPDIQALAIPVLLPLLLSCALLFAEKTLRLKYHNRRLFKLGRLGASLCLLLALVTPFIGFQLYLAIAAVLGVTLLLTVSLRLTLGQHKLARWYLAGWITLLAGIIFAGLGYSGLIQLPVSPLTAVTLALSLDVVFMSLVLAIRYSDERRTKQHRQQAELDQALKIREAKENALKAEAEANERLEDMVQERTLELEIALRELNEVNQKLTEQSTIDSLTGVKNRAAFDKRLQAEGRISRRQQTPIALLMLDIDHFKQVNDQFGHLAGDLALQGIAGVLTTQVKRPTDLVSRFGGEEFAIILPSTDTEGALAVAECIRQAVEMLDIRWESRPIRLTISIGISCTIIENEAHPLQLLEQADKALYQAKYQGRNRVNLHQSGNAIAHSLGDESEHHHQCLPTT